MSLEYNRLSASPYTCITCRVAFRDLEIQRQHYKSDWHRYNLKRKVAELPPVAVEEFQKRVIAQRGKEDQLKGDKTTSCKICRKNFSTTNQFDNHVLSKKHKERVLRKENEQEEEEEAEEDENEEEEEEVDDEDDDVDDNDDNVDDENEEEKGKEDLLTKGKSDRLGVSKISKTLIKLANNTSNENKTTNDDMDVDSDVETVDSDDWNDNPAAKNDCLFCNNHSRSFLRNLKHMTIAHSFFIPDPEYCIDPKGLLVYIGKKIFSGYLCVWCNEKGKAFQSSDAARAHMIDKGHCKIFHEGVSLAEYAEFYDYTTSYPDADDDLVDPDAEIEIPEIDDSDYQLVLPSGNVIGHRSLMRYYKQSFDPNKPLAIPRSEKLRKVLCQYRALGWSQTEKTAVEKKARDISYMQRVQAKYSTKLQFKANKFQPHFRQQVNY